MIRRTGTLPNGAPTGGIFSDLIQRDPVTGAVLNVSTGLQNLSRIITEGLDYEASYQLDTSISAAATSEYSRSPSMATTWLGMYDRRPRRTAKLIFTTELGRTKIWLVPEKPLVYKRVLRGRQAHARRTRCRRDRPLHWAVLGQHQLTRKVREWTTLDLIVNYTFNLPATVAQNKSPDMPG